MGVQKYFGTKTKSLVGLDIGSFSVKIAVIRSWGTKNPRLEYYRRQILPPGTIIDNTIQDKTLLAKTIERLFPAQSFRRYRIATALSSDSVILKKLIIPNLPDNEIGSSLRWEIAQEFPGELDELNYDYALLSERRRGRPLELLLVAARKEEIAERNEVIRMAGLKPAVVDVDSLVIHNLYLRAHGPSQYEAEAVLNVGARITNLNILRGSSLIFTRYLLTGGNQYVEHFQQQLGLSVDQALTCLEPNSPAALLDRASPILDTLNQSLALEIKKIITQSRTLLNTTRIDSIRLCGGGSQIPGLRESLSQILDLPVYILDPLRNLDSKNFSTEADSALAIGLALRLFLDDD